MRTRGADISIGMGGSAARALAFGKPLIVSGEHGWYRTFDEESKAALYRNSFWSDDKKDRPVELLVNQLREVIDDPTLRRDLGTLGRQFAEANFGLAEMTKRLVAVYENAACDATTPVVVRRRGHRNEARRGGLDPTTQPSRLIGAGAGGTKQFDCRSTGVLKGVARCL